MSRINVLDKGVVELIDTLGTDNTIVSAARVSVLGATKGIEKDIQLIKYLLENKHTSPFEQVEFQFRVKCPIFIARQWMRHRTWNFNETSRRYTSQQIEFHIPETLRKQSSENHQSSIEDIVDNEDDFIQDIEQFSYSAYTVYKRMLEAGVCREQARMVLPVNLYTMFYAKVDLHNLMHFINLRLHPHAQYEMQQYARALDEFVKQVVPITYRIWRLFEK